MNKQYPDLMAGKTILYVHGFGSAASSGTVTRIQATLPQAHVIAYDLPLHPEEAMMLLHKVCDEQKPDLIIGTSMGGMYTEMLRGFDRICVNPAFQMGETMKEHNMMGKQCFQNPRQDGVQEFIVTKQLLKEYRDICEQCFQGCDDASEQRRVYGLFGDEDPLVHTYDLFLSHYPQAIHFHGEHRLDDKALVHGVIPVIRWISDRQECRERPVVLIHFDALHDDYMNPKASMMKAYEFLIERYDVRVVAPAPTAKPEAVTTVQQWVEQHLSAPAWNRVVFTCDTQLLMGDYLIGTAAELPFLGTYIQLGSDEFKTWEEVITYFDRLGGQ